MGRFAAGSARMERLSDWKAAAWLAACLAAIATAAALLVPAGITSGDGPPRARPTLHATLIPRTHLFGQPVTATLDGPAGLTVKGLFTPYRLVSRTVKTDGRTTRYRFVLDCLTSACIGSPGTEREIRLPPVTIGLPDGKKLIASWPPLRQASRLAPTDLLRPVLRGDLTTPDRPTTHGHRLLYASLLAIAAVLGVCVAALLGLRWLSWRPSPFRAGDSRPDTSDLDYALIVTGLSAGGSAGERRAALESLAVALDQRGLSGLARRARDLAWSPRPPAGESVRRLAERAQRAVKGHA